MDLKVELPSHPTDFQSPHHHHHTPAFFFYSAPSSPSRLLDDHLPLLSTTTTPSSSVPFTWESHPGVPKPITPPAADQTTDDDFQFDFNGHLDRPPLSAADELFHAGQIRPLKPPPRLHSPPSDSPRSPISKLKSALSPKHRPNPDFDPFEAALERTRRHDFPHRGRPHNNPDQRSSSRRGISRSLSPLRVSEFALSQQQQLQEQSDDSISRRSSFRRWRLKDLLLFRSASEGRPNAKLPIHGGDDKNSRSSRRRSAHELHYAANKAASEEMKKKTYLPYRFGFLGCLGFNPSATGLQEISRGFGYSFGR